MECLKPFSSVRTWEFLHSSKYNVKWTNMQYEVNNVLNLQMKTSDREFCFILVLALTVTCALWTNHLRILFSWTRTVVYHLLVYTSIRLSIVCPSINPSWGLLSGEITRGVVEECFLSWYLYPKVINEQSKYHLFQFVIFCNLTKDTLVFHFRLFHFFFYHLSQENYPTFLNLSFSLWNWDPISHSTRLLWNSSDSRYESLSVISTL